jgi:signal transduction histidine kinase
VTRRLGRRPVDVLIVLLALAALVKSSDPPGDERAVFIVGSLLWTLPLLLRHRYPFAAPVFAFAVQAASSFADPTIGVEATATVALLLAFWVAGAGNEGSRALAAAAIGLSTIAVVAQQDVELVLTDAVVGGVMGGGICLIAYTLQWRTRLARELEQRAVRIERERAEQTRAAVAEERKRIARELHDVIAHSVSVMTVQAGAARLVLDAQPERADAPLRVVEQTGHQALAEMGRLLGILREGEGEVAFARQPGMADLDALIEQARQAGLSVELAVDGNRAELPPGVDLAAYRVVQEALTNALKHAGPTHAQVTVRFGRKALDLEIRNDGRVASNGDRGGHGLVGMRERVGLYGGELEAGPRTGGGYTVRARLPVEAAKP